VWGRALGGIRRYDFDILVWPKAKQHVVRANAGMRAASNRALTQMAFQIGRARFQRCGANHKMINFSHVTPKIRAAW
jgi:hypothetical protein